MKVWHALVSGLAGAAAVTILHQTVRMITPDAPRMDLLGMRAIEKSMRRADMEPPKGDKLYNITLAGDLVSNSLYYSLIGIGRDASTWFKGLTLGLVAGMGGVALPGPLGLGAAESSRTRTTQALTVLLYLTGGAVSALAYNALRDQYED